jgi:hypothetical protein
MQPAGQCPLNQLANYNKSKIPIDQLTIAYSRPPNFGNVFSVRKFHKRWGPEVLSFI